MKATPALAGVAFVLGGPMGFNVREFGVDDEIYTVGLAEQPGGGGRHLLFMTSEDDLDDADQDMDSYCITDERGACIYGGVMSAGIAETVLRLEFTDRAAADLALDGPVLELTLDLSLEQRAQLAAAFRRVFSFGREAFRPHLSGDLT